jgi:hypothetical protein
LAGVKDLTDEELELLAKRAGDNAKVVEGTAESACQNWAR